MSTRTGFIAAFSAAVAASFGALWVLNSDGEGEGAAASTTEGEAEPPVASATATEASAALSPAVGESAEPSTRDAAEIDAGEQREDALAKPETGATPANAGPASDAPAPRDAGLGSAPVATNTETYAQEIASNLGWPALGPYEANQLGAEAAQFVQARAAALDAQAVEGADAPWATLNRSAEELAAAWVERFGRARCGQLLEYLNVTGFDPTSGEPRALDLDALASARRER
jgi:hypothetical protein